MWEGRAGRLLLSGLAVQLATYPAVAYHFFIYPPYSIFLNLLVIPLMTYAMVSGLLCLAVGGFCPPLGRVCIGGGYYILECYEALCRLWGRLPGSSLVIGRPALWQIALYGAILILFAAACSGLRRKKAWLAGITAALFFLLFRGIGLGMSMAHFYLSLEGKGILLSLLLLLPAGALSSYALLLGCRESLRMSNRFFRAMTAGEALSPRGFRIYVAKFGILLLMLGAAALLDAGCSHLCGVFLD